MPNEVINPATNAPYLTVEELSQAVKRTVETAFEYVRVRGEISQPRTPASGHIYLTLKDDRNLCLLLYGREQQPGCLSGLKTGLMLSALGK